MRSNPQPPSSTSGALTPPGATQPNPLLDNFEGVALGSRLPDGRHTLFLISDDNESASQTTRVSRSRSVSGTWVGAAEPRLPQVPFITRLSRRDVVGAAAGPAPGSPSAPISDAL